MKYNWPIIGHEKQLLGIERDLASGNIAHGYLFTGPENVGKYTVAKNLAKILQCENNFCHECSSCLQIAKGSHLDTMELNSEGSIKIDGIRSVIERLSMTRQSPYKVLLINSLERMTIEAANCFLKTLEEPTEKTVFIMTSNSPSHLLATITSRARVIKFSSVSINYLSKKLQELYPETGPEVIKNVSLFSMGKTGVATSLISEPDLLANYMEIYHHVQNFLDHRSFVDRFKYIENLQESSENILVFLNILTGVLRTRVIEGRQHQHLKTLSKIKEAGMLLQKNVNVKLVLENLMLSL